MKKIYKELIEKIEEMVIPEIEEYLADMNKIVASNDNTPEDDNTIEDLKTFLNEILNVKKALEEESLSDDEVQEVKFKIDELIEQSKDH
jgi:hypothetical protein